MQTTAVTALSDVPDAQDSSHVPVAVQEMPIQEMSLIRVRVQKNRCIHISLMVSFVSFASIVCLLTPREGPICMVVCLFVLAYRSTLELRG